MSSPDIITPHQHWTLDKLESWLGYYDINPDQYGTGEAKTLDNLLDELQTGESQLFLSKDKLFRKVNAVGIKVYYQNGSGLYRLEQTLQQFRDGREKIPHNRFSVSEKMFPNENPLVAARRALLEELGIVTEIDLAYEGLEECAPRLSTSYPGLWTQANIEKYLADLPVQEFVPAGYVEQQVNEVNYFEWVKMK